jgi:hypothetical protein
MTGRSGHQTEDPRTPAPAHGIAEAPRAWSPPIARHAPSARGPRSPPASPPCSRWPVYSRRCSCSASWWVGAGRDDRGDHDHTERLAEHGRRSAGRGRARPGACRMTTLQPSRLGASRRALPALDLPLRSDDAAMGAGRLGTSGPDVPMRGHRSRFALLPLALLLGATGAFPSMIGSTEAAPSTGEAQLATAVAPAPHTPPWSEARGSSYGSARPLLDERSGRDDLRRARPPTRPITHRGGHSPQDTSPTLSRRHAATGARLLGLPTAPANAPPRS